MNKVILIGTITDKIITTTRTSGVTDEIPIQTPLSGYYKVVGSLHSYNTPDRHLKLYVQPETIMPVSMSIGSDNTIELSGYLCKSPIIRTTPNGRTICDLLLAIPREIGSDYLPCIAWGNIAKEAAQYKIADQITINGRIQSRTYYKNEETKTTYEISINKIN